MKTQVNHISAAILLTSTSLFAFSAVSDDEAKQLGGSLTPWGAEKAGNKDGSIPEWTGQVKPPASYDPKYPGVRPDPFANEKPLFSITAQNMDKYSDKLAEGVRAMLKLYPTFRLDIYPSHRTATYPQYVVDNSVKNATSCKSLDKGLRIDGCYAGLPFPIPKTGNEVMWNHELNYNAYSWYSDFNAWLVDSSGKAILQATNITWQDSPYYNPKRTGVNAPNLLYWRLRADQTAPTRVAGQKLVFWDPVDPLNVGRRVWQYIPGQRRVKLAPDLAYDTPNPQSGGASLMDEGKLFLGAQDRFDFKLIGKREMFIPYNMFKFNDGKACPNSVKLTKNHVNPDCIRWELHRVWAVEATLKPEFRHVYKRRMFYWDEDVPGTGVTEGYDGAGKMYRVGLGVYIPFYETTGMTTDTSMIFNLQTGTYTISGDATDGGGWYPRTPNFNPDIYYSSESMAGEGIR